MVLRHRIRQNLNRHFPRKLCIDRSIHSAHASFAKFGGDAVVGDCCGLAHVAGLNQHIIGPGELSGFPGVDDAESRDRKIAYVAGDRCKVVLESGSGRQAMIQPQRSAMAPSIAKIRSPKHDCKSNSSHVSSRVRFLL